MKTHVFVSGASRGIGLELAKHLPQLKALNSFKEVEILLVSRRFDPEVRAELQQHFASLKPNYRYKFNWTELDLSDLNAAKKFAESTPSPWIQFHNAGLLTGGLLEEQDPEEISKMFRVNLEAPILLSRIWLPERLQEKSGHLIYNTSVSAQMYFPCASTYAASKAGLFAFAESLRQEVRDEGLQVLTLLTPGVKTKMYDDISNLYGSHLDLLFLSSQPASSWAQQVMEAVNEGRDYCLPKGSSRAGLWTAKHFPKAFEKVVATRFKR